MAGGLIYCLDDTETTHVLKPGPELEIVARNELPQQFWATPVVADGRIYLRGAITLFCVGKENITTRGDH